MIFICLKELSNKTPYNFGSGPFFNAIAGVLLGVSTFFCFINKTTRNLEISLFIVNLLGLISAIYLVMSIYRIKRLTKENKIEINTKIMILHVSTVTIYLLSLLIYVCGSTVSPNKYFVAVAYSLEIFCNHLIQVLICYIFWNMENIKIVPQQAA